MYLLDWKVPKRLEEPIDKIFSMWEEVTTLRPSSQTKAKQALSCFVYNAEYNISRGKRVMDVVLKKEAYVKPLIYNCNKVKRSVSYTHTRKLLDWLVSEGFITLNLGSVEEWKSIGGVITPENLSKSYVELSSELVGLIVPDNTKTSLEKITDVIEVRDDKGNKVSKRLGEKERGLILLLNKYNNLILETKVESQGERYWVQAKKVYNNNSFECGGRTYMTGDTEVMRNSIRSDLLINDDITVELDYASLHPRLIAELEGVAITGDFDPYGIVMEGYDKKCLRSIVKVATLCSINAKSFNVARKALNYHLMKCKELVTWKKDRLVPSVIASGAILDTIRIHNPYLSNWLYQGKGGMLQNIDSKIMDYIIDAFQQEGRILIPIHDGLICQKRFTRWATGIMIDAYEDVLGSKYNVKITED